MAGDLKEIELTTPFQSIALCFSGGGFRAAAYALGVLSYLNRSKIKIGDFESSLLANVTYVASTSGGTITNLVYSSILLQCKNEEQAFYKTFKKLYGDMNGEDLLISAIDKIADDNEWDKSKTSKQRNIINAFAKMYDEKLFNGETFDVFWREPLGKDFSVCFNATEFKRGISFRFQYDSDNSLYELTGNKFIHFDRAKNEVFGKLKLADILAASSCFPSGFEPINIPEDFAYLRNDRGNELSVAELSNALLFEDYNGTTAPITEPISLMDGGVADNQGVNSAMTADKRRRKKNKHPFDLIMVNDVTSYFMEPYIGEPETGASWGKDNAEKYLGKLKIAGRIYKQSFIWVSALLLLSIAGLIFAGNNTLLSLSYILLGVSLVGILGLAYLTGLKHGNPLVNTLLSGTDKLNLNELIKEKIGNTFSDDMLTKLLSYLKVAKLSTLHHLVTARVKSVVTMSVEVNLKHVRRLIYTIFYENKIWDDRRVPNFIYELSFRNIRSREERFTKKDETLPSSFLTAEDIKLLTEIKNEIPKIAEEAREMGTTLWFSNSDVAQKKLEKIIVCGQFTTCVNLLEYTLTLIRQTERGRIALSEPIIKNLNELKDRLVEDWALFKESPSFLFTEEVKQLDTIK